MVAILHRIFLCRHLSQAGTRWLRYGRAVVWFMVTVSSRNFSESAPQEGAFAPWNQGIPRTFPNDSTQTQNQPHAYIRSRRLLDTLFAGYLDLEDMSNCRGV